MILWQKRVSPAWLIDHEERFASPRAAIISQPERVRSLLQVLCESRPEASRLLREFGGSARSLSHHWEKEFLPRRPPRSIRIGRRLRILGQPTNGRVAGQLVIPAESAFGTGEHATTAMSLRLLEEITRRLSPGWRMLDAGTGSGILALAACSLGARAALGLDNDPGAIAIARRNARRNRLRQVRFLRANLLSWEPVIRYDVVAANLFSEMIIAALPIFRRTLSEEGKLILSGILRGQAESVLHSLGKAGFRFTTLRRRGKWIALCCVVRRRRRRALPASCKPC